MNNNIDKGKGFLKDKLAGYQPDPPPEVWESISDRIREGGGRRKIIIILSAAASLALAVTLGITYFGRDVPMDMELTSSTESEITLPGAGDIPSPGVPDNRLEERVVEALAKVNSNGGKKSEFRLATEDMKLDRPGPAPLEQTILDDGVDTEKEASMEAATELSESEDDDPEASITGSEETLAGEDLDLDLDAGGAVGDEILTDISETGDRDPRWVLGAVLSPLYSFRDAQPEALAGASGQETGTLSYAAGFQVGYRATRRLAIESGILFNKMGISIGAPGIQVFSDGLDFAPAGTESVGGRVMSVTNTVGNIVSNSGEIYVNNYLLNATKEYDGVSSNFPEAVNAEQGIRQHLDYLELPVNLRYTLLDRDFKIQLLGGMSTNFLVNNYVSMESEGASREIGYLTNVRNVNYSGNAGLGFVYHFLDQLSLSVEPRFRYYLNSVNDATLPSTRPYTFGIYTGINYFF